MGIRGDVARMKGEGCGELIFFGGIGGGGGGGGVGVSNGEGID